MSRVRGLALAQRLVLVVGLGLCLLSGWLWWYSAAFADDVQTVQNLFRSEMAVSPEDDGSSDTYYGVTSGGWEHLAVPVGLVVLWTAASIWLLGPRDDADDRPADGPTG